MSRRTPCKRRDFIRRLRRLGFDGPFAGTRHAFVTFGGALLAVPSNDEFSVPQLRALLAEAEAILGRKLTREEWEALE